MATHPTPLAERFWRKVRKSEECWIWTGARLAYGYGAINGGRQIGVLRAHRVSWELHRGPVPEGMQVLHRCDNPPCVNPDHLFLGTPDDNSRDKVAKGRLRVGGVRGTQHGRAKLTEDAVRAIRAAHASGTESQSALARRYGVSQKAIAMVLKAQTWTHV